MFVAIINHGLVEQTLELKRRISMYSPTEAIDSGSELTPAQSAGFDVCLPNVYYSGLINAVALRTAALSPDQPVLIWCSDVTCDALGRLFGLLESSFDDPTVGSYAPSAWYSYFKHMHRGRKERVRPVTFVDGFCFATRVRFLRQLCPIDTTLNMRGWGLEVHLGYLVQRAGMKTVIDDRIQVAHPPSTGYSTTTAADERRNWVEHLPQGARVFHRLANHRFGRASLGMKALLRIAW